MFFFFLSLVKQMKEDFIQALAMTLNLLLYEEGEDDAR